MTIADIYLVTDNIAVRILDGDDMPLFVGYLQYCPIELMDEHVVHMETTALISWWVGDDYYTEGSGLEITIR